MLFTHPDPNHHYNRPIATHGKRRPDPALVLAMIEMRILELPSKSIRRRALEQMIEHMRDWTSSTLKDKTG